jgi:hypothetical protein
MNQRELSLIGHGHGYRQQYFAPNFFHYKALQYLSFFIDFAGEEYDKRLALLDEPIPGTSPDMTKVPDMPHFSKRTRANVEILCAALAGAMQGRMPNAEQQAALEHHASWLILPPNLREYAVNFLHQTALIGDPERAIEQFPMLYVVVAHPVLTERLFHYDILPDNIQQTFRDHPELDPIESIWFLSGAMHTTIVNEKLEWEFLPTAKLFAQLVLGPKLKEGEDPLHVLLGFDKSPTALAREFEFDDIWSMQQKYGVYAVLFPEGNDNLNKIRVEYFKKFCRLMLQLPSTPESDALNLNQLSALCLERLGHAAMDEACHAWYPAWPDIFIKSTIRRDRAFIPVAWTDVQPDLRARLEAAGVASANQLWGQLMMKSPGQFGTKLHPMFVMHNSCDHPGYVFEAQDILRALLHPEHAYFANGAGINPLYARMLEAAGADMDFDTFWGITRPPLDTPEKQMAAAFHVRVTEALSKAEIFKNCISNEQISYFLGVSPDQYRALFEKPYNNYSIPRGAPEPVPSEAMSVVERELGVSFREEWQTLHTARVGAAKVLEQRAAAEAAQRRAMEEQSKAPPDPWKGVHASVAAAIKTKFETPQDLAAAIFENIRSTATLDERVAARLPGMIAQEVDQALRSKVAGVSNENLPLDIMHARILKATGPAQREVAKAIFESRPKALGIDACKHTVLANITALAIENPRLAAFLNWRHVKNETGASVPSLIENIASAYQIRSLRDPALVLIASEPLTAIVSALNLGLEEAYQCLPDQIVPVETWKLAHKARTGRDAVPAPQANKTLQITLG